MKTKTEERTISYEEFLRINKTEDLCFEVADGKISDDILINTKINKTT